MILTYSPFELTLKYPFSISGFSRTFTPIMLIEISYEGFTGLGEASMVPYMGESVETAIRFLSKVDLRWLKYPFEYDKVINYLDTLEAGNPAVKAAIDIALHDLEAKIAKVPCYKLFGSDPQSMPLTSGIGRG